MPGYRAYLETSLHRQLARATWRADPLVRLFYYPEHDALVAELLDAPSCAEETAHNGRLLVTFDGTDAAALPTSLTLVGFRGSPASAAADEMRALLGSRLWATALLLDADNDDRQLSLTPAEATERLQAWSLLTERVLPSMAFGFELRPGLLRVMLVDAEGTRLGQHERTLDSMAPHDVVDAAADMVEDMCRRYARDLRRRRYVVGFQLGGTVTPGTGVVEYYNKPINPHEDEPWPPSVPLADILRKRMGVPVFVENDVRAFAALERWSGDHPTSSSYVVIVVRRGIGGTLVRNGKVDEQFPMELGTVTTDRDSRGARIDSIEAKAAEQAIIDMVFEYTGVRKKSVEDAACLANETSSGEKAVFAFLRAGEELAVAIANVQAIACPHAYVIYTSHTLAGESGAAARAYRTGLDQALKLVTHEPLRSLRITVKPIVRDVGARGAAYTALERSGISSAHSHRRR